MIYFLYILLFIIWICLGYWYFYYTYEKRGIIHELRKHNNELVEANIFLEWESKELAAQNDIFRRDIQELYTRNDDLTQVVSELSRYYYRLQKWAALVQELHTFLSHPDENMKQILSTYIKTNETTTQVQSSKQFPVWWDNQKEWNSGFF